MERLGLGTKSSRPSILEKLVDRGYIGRNKTQIISNASGRALVQVLEPIWPDIVTNTFPEPRTGCGIAITSSLMTLTLNPN